MIPPREINEPQSLALQQTVAAAVDVLTKFSIPLYIQDEYGRPEQFGTGFIVRVDTHHFLVSAAHVLDLTRKTRVFFYATPNTLRALDGKVKTTGHPDSRDDDALDVGVMKLSGVGLPPYREVDKFAMEISYLRPHYLPRADKHYVTVGFPATKSSVDNRHRTTLVTPYAYRSDSIDDAQYPVYGVAAKTHVVIPLDLKKGLDPKGQTRTFPKPQGMSGSPIVVLYEESPENQSRVFPVVAVGTRYRKSAKILIGADVDFALGAIREFLARSD